MIPWFHEKPGLQQSSKGSPTNGLDWTAELTRPLTKAEYQNRKQYERLLDEKRPEEDKALQVFMPNQAPDKVCKVSRNGVLPTLTATDRIVWNRGQKRWMLAAHGFPMTAELARLRSSEKKIHVGGSFFFNWAISLKWY